MLAAIHSTSSAATMSRRMKRRRPTRMSMATRRMAMVTRSTATSTVTMVAAAVASTERKMDMAMAMATRTMAMVTRSTATRSTGTVTRTRQKLALVGPLLMSKREVLQRRARGLVACFLGCRWLQNPMRKMMQQRLSR